MSNVGTFFRWFTLDDIFFDESQNKYISHILTNFFSEMNSFESILVG